MRGPEAQMTTTFSLGEITIHRIVEQESPFLPVLDFLPGLTPERLEENRAWLEPRGLEPGTGRLILCFQSYILRTPDHTVLVDSCIGNDKDRPTRPNWHMKRDDTFMRGLAAHGLSVADIDVVMCTHLHADHVGWNTRLEEGRWVPTFPNARYLFSDTELTHWTAQHEKAAVPAIADSVLPIVGAKRAEVVQSDHAVGDYVRLLPTPGHTPGHFSVLVGKTAEEAVSTGDWIHSPLQARYPELSMQFDFDRDLAARTRRAFLERFCDTGTLCCTAHFPSPSAGRIAPWGNGFRCDPVEA
jgi:glyoxylase-like metal-dependent hydrolase (beta-lactamase superfamily II)